MCGIVGISHVEDNAVLELYEGLLMLQHRGQDAAGIVTFDGKHFHERRGKGMVSEVFGMEEIVSLPGTMGLGHVRYPTAGTNDVNEAQPFFVNAPFGIYLIHNGNLTNVEFLRQKILETYHRHLRTESDTEVLLNVFADHIYQVLKTSPGKTFDEVVFEAITMTMNLVSGAYSVITLIDKVGLFAFRDPYGIRPLVIGRRRTTKGDEWMLASEDVALRALGYETYRDVRPGEAVLITPDGNMVTRQCREGTLSPCIFEFVYLARPDSMIDGISVYKARLRMGTFLARQIAEAHLEIDSVMPIPDSGRPAAIQIAQDLGVKYREGLIKNRYVGRTFIMPGQEIRNRSIRRKLSPIELEFRGKNILLVDDSIVRGNTIRQIVNMCRAAGAKKVYVASAAPPVLHPDVYGIDLPTRKELVAPGLSTDEIGSILNVDKLFYQTVDDLVAACRFGNPDIKNFQTGCFSGDYVTPEVDEAYLQKVEFEGRGAKQEKLSLPTL